MHSYKSIDGKAIFRHNDNFSGSVAVIKNPGTEQEQKITIDANAMLQFVGYCYALSQEMTRQNHKELLGMEISNSWDKLLSKIENAIDAGADCEFVLFTIAEIEKDCKELRDRKFQKILYVEGE